MKRWKWVIWCVLTWGPPHHPSPPRPRAAWPRPRWTPASEWAPGTWRARWETACSRSGSRSGSWYRHRHRQTLESGFRTLVVNQTRVKAHRVGHFVRKHLNHFRPLISWTLDLLCPQKQNMEVLTYWNVKECIVLSRPDNPTRLCRSYNEKKQKWKYSDNLQQFVPIHQDQHEQYTNTSNLNSCENDKKKNVSPVNKWTNKQTEVKTQCLCQTYFKKHDMGTDELWKTSNVSH